MPFPFNQHPWPVDVVRDVGQLFDGLSADLPHDPAPPWGPLLLHDYKPFQSNFPGHLFTLQPLSSASPAEWEYLNFLAPWLRQLLPPRALWVRWWGRVGQRRTRGRGLAFSLCPCCRSTDWKSQRGLSAGGYHSSSAALLSRSLCRQVCLPWGKLVFTKVHSDNLACSTGNQVNRHHWKQARGSHLLRS